MGSVSNSKVQVKFTIDSGTAAAFKSRCANNGVSMASVISKWMEIGQPANALAMKIDTRPQRRKTALWMIAWLEELLGREEQYKDAIPEQFETRYETSSHTCEQLEQALSFLEDAY